MADSKYWSGKNVFITGATGLVGSWLVKDLCKSGANAVCLVRDYTPRSLFFQEGLDKITTIVSGQLEDLSVLERTINEYEISNVIHLGAQTIVGAANRSPLSTFESNVRGTWNLLEVCRQNDEFVKSVVVASSDKAYGDQPVLPYTELTSLQGKHPYDVSKSCVDLISQAYANTYALPVTISRCGNFFGPGDLNFNRLVPGTVLSILRGQRPVIRSDGKYVRDYIYVEDASAAYSLLGRKTEQKKLCGEAFNFSNENQYTVLELVKLIIRLMGKRVKPRILNKARGEIKKQHLSAAKARKVLGWKSRYSVEDGLQKSIDWYSSKFKAGLFGW
ncbi:MAG: GDP-mannose 4,6-dehydratase [Candidatus Micrarchaeia archaeon]